MSFIAGAVFGAFIVGVVTAAVTVFVEDYLRGDVWGVDV